MTVANVRLIDLDFSALREMPIDGSEVEKYREELRCGMHPLLRARASRYSGKVIVLDEAGRCVATAARLEDRSTVLVEIVT